MNTTILYRPVGPVELELIQQSGWTRFPPRLPEQPFFYPVLTREYAIEIARDWNVRFDGAGFVTRFSVLTSFLHRYPVQVAGAQRHQELWVPAADMEEFNRHIEGVIEIIDEFRPTTSNQQQ